MEIPLFYACYLLKSISSPRSFYIGSTSNPLRVYPRKSFHCNVQRLRQHNGLIGAGASRTSRRRPWDMSMMVYGFPSKLAALQFEWAWQHPHKTLRLSLETRTEIRGSKLAGKKRRNPRYTLQSCIENVSIMLVSDAWNRWPLKIKVFSAEAWAIWSKIHENPERRLPAHIVLEFDQRTRVDRAREGSPVHEIPRRPGEVLENIPIPGKSISKISRQIYKPDEFGGLQGIDIFATQFMTNHLTKAEKIFGSGIEGKYCSICMKPFSTKVSRASKSPHENVILCTAGSCTHLSHIRCLATNFLASNKFLLPVSGYCPKCNSLVHWVDLIRGIGIRAKASLNTQTGKIVNNLDLVVDQLDDGDTSSSTDTRSSSKS